MVDLVTAHSKLPQRRSPPASASSRAMPSRTGSLSAWSTPSRWISSRSGWEIMPRLYDICRTLVRCLTNFELTRRYDMTPNEHPQAFPSARAISRAASERRAEALVAAYIHELSPRHRAEREAREADLPPPGSAFNTATRARGSFGSGRRARRPVPGARRARRAARAPAGPSPVLAPRRPRASARG